METKIFSGDINAIQIREPEGSIELAPFITLRTHGGRRVVIHGTEGGWNIWHSDDPLWQSLRTLFLRQPSEDEE